jgi:hypothetical protein
MGLRRWRDAVGQLMGQSQSPERRVPSRRYGLPRRARADHRPWPRPSTPALSNRVAWMGGDGAAAAVLAMQERCGERSRAGGRSHLARSGRLARSTTYARSSSGAGVSGSATATPASRRGRRTKGVISRARRGGRSRHRRRQMGTWPRRFARPLLGGGPRAIDAPPRRVSARAKRSYPSASRSVSQTRAWHRPSPPRGGCPVHRFGCWKLGRDRRLLAVDPEGSSVGGRLTLRAGLQPRSRKPPKRDRAEERSLRP